jgi:cell division protein ZapE
MPLQSKRVHRGGYLVSPIKEYERRVAAGALNNDPNQRDALEMLDRLHNDLASYKPSKLGYLKSFFSGNRRVPMGLYIYGGVGRGKSMLMDMFYELAPTHAKRRVHFHGFMQQVHDAMHRARKAGVEDALKPIAQEIIESTDLLCFDEMQISDITDAMIVGRLFEYLFNAGVVIVTTSNRPPDDLYKDGLNRSLFLPFIEMLKTRLTVYCLDSQTDHRQNRLTDQQLYFHPLDEATDFAVTHLWQELSGGTSEPLAIKRKGRDISIPAFSSGVGKASFDDLCAKPLGPGDYLAIANTLRVLILTDIPKLSKANNNEAKRFVTLIDALYEAKVKLIASAAAEPEKLYTDGRGAFEFERTASRLREMQSADWFV